MLFDLFGVNQVDLDLVFGLDAGVDQSFVQALVVSAFSLASRSFLCQIINTQDHIL